MRNRYSSLLSVIAGLLLISSGTVHADKDHSKAKKKSKSLPPGLQKKVARGGELPPGWQKKLAVGQVLDQDIYDLGRLVKPVDSRGILTLQVDDRILRLSQKTREIIEIIKPTSGWNSYRD